jgi:coenzyme PQQ precursor peptide PqqA
MLWILTHRSMQYNFHTYIRHVCVNLTRRIKMAWTTPAAQDLRFGFEITMYIANR